MLMMTHVIPERPERVHSLRINTKHSKSLIDKNDLSDRHFLIMNILQRLLLTLILILCICHVFRICRKLCVVLHSCCVDVPLSQSTDDHQWPELKKSTVQRRTGHRNIESEQR